MSKHITIDPQDDIATDRIVEFVANYAIAGEKVRLAKGARFRGEPQEATDARNALFQDRELTVAELRLDKVDDGHLVNYRFEGIEGVHNARAFQNHEGFEQDYGILIHREGETWFVPIDGTENPTAGEAKRVAPVMERCGHYHFGIPDEVLQANGREPHNSDRTVESFLASHEAEPTAGEYALSPLADGTWRLDASPWMSSTSEKEVELAEEAIAAAKNAPSPR